MKPPKTIPKYPHPFPPRFPLQKAQMDNQQITDVTDKQVWKSSKEKATQEAKGGKGSLSESCLSCYLSTQDKQ